MKRKTSMVVTSIDVVQKHLIREILKGIIDNSTLRDSDSSVLSQTFKKDKVNDAKSKLSQLHDISIKDDFFSTDVTYIRQADNTCKLEWKNQHLALTKNTELILHTLRTEEQSIKIKKYCLILVKPRRQLFKRSIARPTLSTSSDSLFDDVYTDVSADTKTKNKAEDAKTKMKHYESLISKNFLDYIEPGLPILANHVKTLSGIVLTFDHRTERNIWLNEFITFLNTVPLDTAHLLDLPTSSHRTSSEHISSDYSFGSLDHSLSDQRSPKHYHSPSYTSPASSPTAIARTFKSLSSFKNPLANDHYTLLEPPSSPTTMFNDRKYSHTLFEDLRKVSPYCHGSFIDGSVNNKRNNLRLART